MADKPDNVERYVKIASILIAVGTLLFGVLQFNANEKAKFAQRETEARKPYLERQLELYGEAARAAATLATSADEKARGEADARFWQLYYGELAMVEDKDVDIAMHEFAIAYKAGLPPAVLQICSIRLAHLLRRSLSTSFGTNIWRSPYAVEPSCLNQKKT